uniref:Protein kinase domain-containing protein n=1 Tax=Parascaris univalens TaxID=6257 RepID=A0A915BC44_PARUN
MVDDKYSLVPRMGRENRNYKQRRKNVKHLRHLVALKSGYSAERIFILHGIFFRPHS